MKLTYDELQKIKLSHEKSLKWAISPQEEAYFKIQLMAVEHKIENTIQKGRP